MRKLRFSIVFLLLLLACIVGAQKRRKSERDHIAQIRPHKRGDIPPNIRKCMNVKCGPQQQCFHGRCIKQDSQCINIKCSKGQRCHHGTCQKQLHRPKKMLCEPLNFKLQKKRCSEQFLKTCNNEVINMEVCGFNRRNGKFFDYASPCQACSDQICNINFYYETSCDAAPRICDQQEECMNGVCTSEFKDPVFENYRTCNQRADCKPNQECAFHKCIDRKDLFNFLSSKSEEQAILFKI